MEHGHTLRPRRFLRAAVALTAIGALVAGCGGDPDSSPPSDTSAAAAAGATLTPLIEQTMEQMLIPGAVVLVRTPDYTWQRAFGTRVIDEDQPVTVDDHFRIGSNTKTMVGTVVLQLVEEGELSLDDPVAKFRPDVPNGENITIAQLLDMRSGLHSYTEDIGFERILDEDPSRAWQPEELLRLGLDGPPYFPPGTGFHYSNTNTVLLGLIIEQLTGRDLRAELQSRIFDPLGLKHTSFPAITDAAIPDPHPQGYMFGTNVSTTETAKLPADQIAQARAGTLKPGDFTDLNPSWGWAAGAAMSTAGDLATYIEAMMTDDDLISADMRRRRLDSIINQDPGNPESAGYGLAIAQFGPMYGHDGSLPGFQSFMAYDPNSRTTLIVLCNLTDGPEGEGGSANQIAKAVIPKILGG